MPEKRKDHKIIFKTKVQFSFKTLVDSENPEITVKRKKDLNLMQTRFQPREHNDISVEFVYLFIKKLIICHTI